MAENLLKQVVKFYKDQLLKNGVQPLLDGIVDFLPFPIDVDGAGCLQAIRQVL